MSRVYGIYENSIGWKYWIKIERAGNKYLVLERQFSPSLQSGWSVCAEFDNIEDAYDFVEGICHDFIEVDDEI